MNDAAPRYALYLAPSPDAPLWAFGSRVTGYDAASGADIKGFSCSGIDAAAWRALTSEPRRYGFHATLKAPLRLRDGETRAGLMTALDRFAGERAAFDLGGLDVAVLLRGAAGDFVALTPRSLPPQLAMLEREAVTAFAMFAAPLTTAEQARRKPDLLSERQRLYLQRWGYPYVLEEFRLHLTLTNFIVEPEGVAAGLRDALRSKVGDARLSADALVLFEQIDPSMRFRIVMRFPFGRG